MLSIVIIVVFFCKDGANEWKVSLPAIYRLQFISCKDKDIGLLCKKIFNKMRVRLSYSNKMWRAYGM